MSTEHYPKKDPTTASYRSIELFVEFVSLGTKKFEDEQTVSAHGDDTGDVVIWAHGVPRYRRQKRTIAHETERKNETQRAFQAMQIHCQGEGVKKNGGRIICSPVRSQGRALHLDKISRVMWRFRKKSGTSGSRVIHRSSSKEPFYRHFIAPVAISDITCASFLYVCRDRNHSISLSV